MYEIFFDDVVVHYIYVAVWMVEVAYVSLDVTNVVPKLYVMLR